MNTSRDGEHKEAEEEDDRLHFLALKHTNTVLRAQGAPPLIREIMNAIRNAIEEDRRTRGSDQLQDT